MEDKVCNKCKSLLPISEFYVKQVNKDGLQKTCKQCSSLKNAEYYSANKEIRKIKIYQNRVDAGKLARQFVLEKLSVGCIDCSEKDLIVLDFDHIGNKKYNISEMINYGYSVESIAKEVEKCVVRCANCHRRKTAKDFNWWKTNI